MDLLSRTRGFDGYKYDVTVYDNLLYEDFYNKDVNLIRGDVRDKEKLSKILNSYDIVVWLAALVGDGACAVNEKVTRDINEDSFFFIFLIKKTCLAFLFAKVYDIHFMGRKIVHIITKKVPYCLSKEPINLE